MNDMEELITKEIPSDWALNSCTFNPDGCVIIILDQSCSNLSVCAKGDDFDHALARVSSMTIARVGE